jgi:hypothetical protein
VPFTGYPLSDGSFMRKSIALMDWLYPKRSEMRGEHLQDALSPKPEPLVPNFKVHSRYGKVRADSRSS